MMTITLDLNETQQAQIVYCKDLDRHLQIYMLAQSDIDAQSQAALDKIQAIQKEVDSLKAVTDARDAIIKSAPPTSASIPVNFDPAGASVAGLQFDVAIPAGVSFVSATPSAGTIAAGKSITNNMVNATTLRVLVFGLNQNLLTSGLLLTLQTSGTSSVPLTISGAVYSDPSGKSVTGTLTIAP